jgi:predicted nucleic-acid-binding protein
MQRLLCLCEFVWVLGRVYKFGQQDISDTNSALANAENVVVNRTAVDAGLPLHDAGGDFADGIIAYEGERLGAETFVYSDETAVSVLIRLGSQARIAD